MKLLSVGEDGSSCTSPHSGESLESVGSSDGMRFAKPRGGCGNGKSDTKRWELLECFH